MLRAERFIDDLKQCERDGEFPALMILYLPNDHTSGTAERAPTPRAQVAVNDLALGRAIEALTRSKFWSTSCVFIVEDDPQDGFDHVDGHRSIALVISPYTPRGQVIHDFYNQTPILHTLERILDLPPMNQMDALAPLMTACFTASPDFRPFTSLPNRVPLDEMNPPLHALRGEQRRWAEISMEQPLEACDRIDEDLFNRILWHAMKGTDAPYPAHFAGAHGAGLHALGLELE